MDSITKVPPTHWDVEDYFDSDPTKKDRTYGKTGGFISPVDFAPMEYAITPNDLESIDTSQLLGLIAARRALEDSGYLDNRQFDRKRVSVILGVTGTLEMVIPLGARLGYPRWRKALAQAGAEEEFIDRVVNRISESYVDWRETSFPGLLGNVVAGRISNQLDLGGTNCVVDAACASSLSAIYLASLELTLGVSDMVLTGGVDTFNDIFMYMCFSKTPALSPTGHARPFDQKADGTILGEGLGMIVLKRLKDAERDGDKIYAVIKSLGTSSDGKGEAVFAPNVRGQVKALENAYQLADVSPSTVELMEAHGTGTRVGDATEVKSLHQIFDNYDRKKPWCALGSVKSQIGHTKAAAGSAGLIKAVMGLYHKVLPPTIKVDKPIAPLNTEDSPFYVNTTKRPWTTPSEHPRRAGVSAFGFGGSNFHCVLEEYRKEKREVDWNYRFEIVAYSAKTPGEIVESVEKLQECPDWKTVRHNALRSRQDFDPKMTCRLVMVLDRDADYKKVIQNALSMLKRKPQQTWQTPGGAFYCNEVEPGKLAVLFPGQGSQYPGMLNDLTCQFPETFEIVDQANRDFRKNRSDELDRDLVDYIYPFPVFDEEKARLQGKQLTDTRVAQPAIGAVSLGAYRALERFGVKPDALGGHSYGELTALCVSGKFTPTDLNFLSAKRGNLMADQKGDLGSMLATQEELGKIEEILKQENLDLVIANRNAPRQGVLSGSTDQVERAQKIFEERGIKCKKLPVSSAFHSKLVASAQKPFAEALEKVNFEKGKTPVYSNTTGKKYPADPGKSRKLLSSQIARPVRFVDEINRMYNDGIRVFLEVGPGSILTGLVKSILKEKNDFWAIALDSSRGKADSILDMAKVLAFLSSLGFTLNLNNWNPLTETEKIEISRPKPKMTIPICGANYIKPERKKKISAEKSNPALAKNNPESSCKKCNPGQNPKTLTSKSSDSNDTASGFKTKKSSRVEKSVLDIDKNREGIKALNSSNPRRQPSNNLAEAIKLTQRNMEALQKIQQQTAQLHQQFLQNQDRAIQSITELSRQQQLLLTGRTAEIQVAPEQTIPVVQKVSQTTPTTIEKEFGEQPQPKIQPERVVQEPVPEQEETAGKDATEISEILLEVISEKTGYPPEMLELDMHLDTDLGIDSIKRVEIMSALKEKIPAAGAIGAQQLGVLKTPGDIVEFISGSTTETTPEKSSPAAGEVTTSADDKMDADDVSRLLLDVVAEKTGYPVEMLEMDMNLDTDLGIDSIKRVEILSALREKIPAAGSIGTEQMGVLKTLRDITNFIAGSGPSVSTTTATDEKKAESLPVEKAEPAVSKKDIQLKRSVITAEPLTHKENKGEVRLLPESLIWIVGKSALSKKIAEQIDSRGYRTRLFSANEKLDPDNETPPSGLIIVSAGENVDHQFVKNSFKYIKAAGKHLMEAAEKSGAVLASVVQLDGKFGVGEFNPKFQPISGALSGMIKTAQMEWSKVNCRVIDVAPDLKSAAQLASQIVDLLFSKGPLEVGITGEGTFSIGLTEDNSKFPGKNFPLDNDDVVIVTGGARGVTAVCARRICRGVDGRKPLLVLMGRTAEPGPEPEWLSNLEDEREIKQKIIQNAQTKLSPARVGEEYRKIKSAREIRKTLADIRSDGGKVEYRSVDVRDPEKVKQAIESIRKELGPIKGLIHGAGVISDKYILDKTDEEFNKVYDTKVLGLENLLACLEEDDLKLMVFFSSSTARFGRVGQVDYAAANEVLNKVACQQAKLRPSCRVISFNWGPWEGGMVTPALADIFREEGIELIPLQQGAELLFGEICNPDAPPEVVVLASSKDLKEETRLKSYPDSSFSLSFERDLNLEDYPFLKSHVIGGKAVLPLSVIIEFLAHGAIHANPGLHFKGFKDLRVLKGVKLTPGRSARMKVLTGKLNPRNGEFVVPVQLGTDDRESGFQPNAEAAIILSDKKSRQKRPVSVEKLPPYPHGSGVVYSEFLFHGPDLRGIEKVQGCSDVGITGKVKTSPGPDDWVKKPLRRSWLADPLALDCGFQLVILWSIEKYGLKCLPVGIGEYTQFGRFSGDSLTVNVKITDDSSEKAKAEIEFIDSDGLLIAKMKDYQCIIDPSLDQAFVNNRLSVSVEV